jgi:hypothetical protein
MPRLIPNYDFVGNNCVDFAGDNSNADRNERKAHAHAISKARGSKAHRTPKEPVGGHTAMPKAIGSVRPLRRSVPALSFMQADIKMAEMLQELNA